MGVNLIGEPERWQQGVEEFILEQVGDSPARVLEVGCGEGGWPVPSLAPATS
jgi:hypothetical protein